MSVKVIPNASRNELLGLTGGVWRIKIAAAPDKGKANKELIAFLSELLQVRKSSLAILKGQTSHSKIIDVEGLTEETVKQRLAAGS